MPGSAQQVSLETTWSRTRGKWSDLKPPKIHDFPEALPRLEEFANPRRAELCGIATPHLGGGCSKSALAADKDCGNAILVNHSETGIVHQETD